MKVKPFWGSSFYVKEGDAWKVLPCRKPCFLIVPKRTSIWRIDFLGPLFFTSRSVVQKRWASKFVPSDTIEIVPHSPVVKTLAPVARQRSTTSLCGCPNNERRPTEIMAIFGCTAFTKQSVDDERLP
jgi:hypothetical protein